jgi:hypothetical protein
MSSIRIKRMLGRSAVSAKRVDGIMAKNRMMVLNKLLMGKQEFALLMIREIENSKVFQEVRNSSEQPHLKGILVEESGNPVNFVTGGVYFF